ncbi:MAG: tripartite tricarboxylate transporter TctB family protein [Bilophila wadsworthia]
MLLSGRTALGLLFLGIGALLLRETYAVDVGAFAVPGEMGTMTYPRILLFGWIGLSILYLLNPGKPFNAHDLRASLPGVSKVVASIAVYIILFATVGLPLGTFLFLLLFFSDALPGHPAHDPFALLGAGLAWLVFEKILGIVVPQPFWVGLF